MGVRTLLPRRTHSRDDAGPFQLGEFLMVGLDGSRLCDCCRRPANRRDYLSATTCNEWPDVGDINTARMHFCSECANDADVMAALRPLSATI